jgi:hypothetical protein
MDQVEHIAREGYDRMVGLQLEDIIVETVSLGRPAEALPVNASITYWRKP